MSTAPSRRAKWEIVCMALFSAIVAYRVATFLLSLAFLLLRGIPFRMVAILHRWDFALVPLVAVGVAVLFSRWIEKITANRATRTRLIALAIVTLLAVNPVVPRVTSEPVMCSPLHIAISDNYSDETIEMIVNKFPYLVNGTAYSEGYDYCPLAQVAYAQRTNLVELLIDKGADVERAVQRLQQYDSEDGVTLVLQTAKNHNKPDASDGL